MNEDDIILKAEETSLSKISIVKNGITFQLYPWVGKTNNTPIESLNFEENIDSTVIGGTLILKDFLDWSGELNIHSFEKLIIELFEVKPEDQNPVKIKKLEFSVISVSQISNKPAIVSYTESDFNIIRIDFCTNEPLITPEEKGILNFDDDFVGYIATDGSGEIPGLINEIFSKLDIENYEIEPTYNGIWIKSNEIAYPWGKSKGQLSLEKIFNYIKNYSVSKINPNAVNYFLWRDTDGYHFKSL